MSESLCYYIYMRWSRSLYTLTLSLLPIKETENVLLYYGQHGQAPEGFFGNYLMGRVPYSFQIMSYTFPISKQIVIKYSFFWNVSHMSICILFTWNNIGGNHIELTLLTSRYHLIFLLIIFFNILHMFISAIDWWLSGLNLFLSGFNIETNISFLIREDLSLEKRRLDPYTVVYFGQMVFLKCWEIFE